MFLRRQGWFLLLHRTTPISINFSISMISWPGEWTLGVCGQDVVYPKCLTRLGSLCVQPWWASPHLGWALRGCKAVCRQTVGRNLEEVALGVLEVKLGRDLTAHTALVVGVSAVDPISDSPALSQQVQGICDGKLPCLCAPQWSGSRYPFVVSSTSVCSRHALTHQLVPKVTVDFCPVLGMLSLSCPYPAVGTLHKPH